MFCTDSGRHPVDEEDGFVAKCPCESHGDLAFVWDPSMAYV